MTKQTKTQTREEIRLKLERTAKVYEGAEYPHGLVSVMPQLRHDGMVPISVAALMERRINSDSPIWKKYVKTGDAIAYHPDGRFKVVLDSIDLRNLNKRSRINGHILVLEDGAYESLEGEEFTITKAGRHVNYYVPGGRPPRRLSEKGVLSNPIWRAIGRDQSLLEEYTRKVFSELTVGEVIPNMDIEIVDPRGCRYPSLCDLGVSWGIEGWARSNVWVSSKMNYYGVDGVVGVDPKALDDFHKRLAREGYSRR